MNLIVLLDPLTDEGREHGEFQGKVSWIRPGCGIDHLCPYFAGQRTVMWLQGRSGNVVLLYAREEKENVLGNH